MAFVAQNLLDLAETNANAKHHRKTYTPEQIKEATDFGVVRGCAFAHNKTGVPLSSLKDWVAHFKCEQTKGEYFKPSKRGTKPLLTPTEELGVAKAQNGLTATPLPPPAILKKTVNVNDGKLEAAKLEAGKLDLPCKRPRWGEAAIASVVVERFARVTHTKRYSNCKCPSPNLLENAWVMIPAKL